MAHIRLATTRSCRPKVVGHKVADIAKLLGVSRQTVYRALEPEAVAK